MKARWADPEYRDRMRRGRWGTKPARSAEQIRADMRDRALVRKFGITRAEFNELLEAQGGVCAICQLVCKSGRALAVDHDHSTGAVRGLLCADCNRALGMLNDDPELLRRAAEYLI